MIDPLTGTVYLTEDADDPSGLLYRATPERPLQGYGSLRAGATLEALVATDAGSFVPDLSVYEEIGTTLTATWAAIPDPHAGEVATRNQLDQVTRSFKLEGAWWDGEVGYVASSYARLHRGSAGEHDGQVWRIDPVAGTLELVVRFGGDADPAGDRFEAPDNITVAPWGGLILCSDGGEAQHLYRVSADGEPSIFARNTRDDHEFAGPAGRSSGSSAPCSPPTARPCSSTYTSRASPWRSPAPGNSWALYDVERRHIGLPGCVAHRHQPVPVDVVGRPVGGSSGATPSYRRFRKRCQVLMPSTWS
jgi:hypothetical protein